LGINGTYSTNELGNEVLNYLQELVGLEVLEFVFELIDDFIVFRIDLLGGDAVVLIHHNEILNLVSVFQKLRLLLHKQIHRMLKKKFQPCTKKSATETWTETQHPRANQCPDPNPN
jgi:hypothetical protein